MKTAKRITASILSVFILVTTIINTSNNVYAETSNNSLSALSKTTMEVDDETDWSKWDDNSHKTIDFQLNYVDARATVSKPGNPPAATGYMTNANQFGIKINMNGNTYTYTFAEGSSESSGVFFAINGNSASPYVLRPNAPATNNGSWVNPKEVRTDYDYYYADNKVKEETIIELSTGEKFKFVQIVEFRNDGVFHRSYMTNLGNDDVDGFRMIAKVDTYLINDYVPVYYGEVPRTYYIKQNNSSLKLRISGLTGVDGSVAAHHQRIWDNGFTSTYANYNQTQMSNAMPAGTLAFGSGDSEIVYSQAPHTLNAGETTELVFAVNFLSGCSVTVTHVDENGKEVAETEFLEGLLDDNYTTQSKNIEGYVLDTDQLPANAQGKFTAAEQYVKYVYKKVYNVTYNGNKNTAGTAPADNKNYLSGEKATVLNYGSLKKDGFKFAGWNTSADGSGTTYQEGDDVNIQNANVALYAVWSEVKTESSEASEASEASSQIPESKVEIINDGNPSTGDNADSYILITLLAAAGAATAIVIIKKKKLNVK